MMVGLNTSGFADSRSGRLDCVALGADNNNFIVVIVR